MSGDRLERQKQNIMIDNRPDNNMCRDFLVPCIQDTLLIG